MENELIVVARRESAQRSINGALSSFGLFTVFLIFDIVSMICRIRQLNKINNSSVELCFLLWYNGDILQIDNRGS